MQTLVAVDLRAGGVDAALATATALARDVANLPNARLLRGGLYMSVQRYADAAAAYQAELQASPSSVLATAAAVALNAAGQAEQAIRLLRDWSASQPKDIEALQTLASLHLQNRRLAEAEKTLAAILEQQPGNAVALNNLAWLYQLKGDGRALPLARKAYLLSPSPQAADTLGWVLTRQGNPAMGLLLLRQAAMQLRTDPTVFYHLAVTLKDLGQKDPAIDILTQIMAVPGEFEDKPAARALLEALGGPKKAEPAAPKP
jgi:tetratricopeptide (TPR) repeat protein